MVSRPSKIGQNTNSQAKTTVPKSRNPVKEMAAKINNLPLNFHAGRHKVTNATRTTTKQEGSLKTLIKKVASSRQVRATLHLGSKK